MMFTQHAQQRCQQRGITEGGVNMIMRYGSEHFASGGALELCITNKDLERLKQKHREEERVIRKLLKKAIIVDGESIITVYHKTK